MTLTHRGLVAALALALVIAVLLLLIIWAFVPRQTGQTVGVVGGLAFVLWIAVRGWSL